MIRDTKFSFSEWDSEKFKEGIEKFGKEIFLYFPET